MKSIVDVPAATIIFVHDTQRRRYGRWSFRVKSIMYAPESVYRAYIIQINNTKEKKKTVQRARYGLRVTGGGHGIRGKEI